MKNYLLCLMAVLIFIYNVIKQFNFYFIMKVCN